MVLNSLIGILPVSFDSGAPGRLHAVYHGISLRHIKLKHTAVVDRKVAEIPVDKHVIHRHIRGLVRLRFKRLLNGYRLTLHIRNITELSGSGSRENT